MAKIVQINVLGNSMSTGRTTRDVHEFLLENGYESYIVNPKHEDSDDAFSFASQNDKYIDVFKSILTGKEGVFSKRPTKKLIKYLDEIKPDIIHLRVLHLYFMNFNMLFEYASKNNIPVVVTMHDFWWMTGLCTNFDKVNCNKWKSGCGNCPQLIINRRRPLFDRTKTNFKNKIKWFSGIKHLAVVGVSKYTEGMIYDSLLKNAEIITYVYNWIDLKVFRPIPKTEIEQFKFKYNIKADDKVILGVSTYWQKGDRKGFDKYIELSEIIPDNWKIILIGEKDKDIDCKKIIFTGTINDASMLAKYYNLCDVYLNLSYEETFGKVSAEAISCGKPVIAINSTANPEIVPENGGILLESAETNGIIEALNEILSKPPEFYADVTRKHAERNFDKEKNIKKYLEIYEKLLESKKKD